MELGGLETLHNGALYLKSLLTEPGEFAQQLHAQINKLRAEAWSNSALSVTGMPRITIKERVDSYVDVRVDLPVKYEGRPVVDYVCNVCATVVSGNLNHVLKHVADHQ